MSTPHATSWAWIVAAFVVGPWTTNASAQTCHMARASIDDSGFEGDAGSGLTSISSDGRYVAFHSAAGNLVANDTNLRDDVFVRDLWTGVTERVSEPTGGGEGDGSSGYASISGDGRFVVFTSWSTNLVPNDTNNTNDVFVRDRATGTTERLSLPAPGSGAEADYSSFIGNVTTNGRFVTFLSYATNLVPGDTNLARDVFLVDRAAGTIERVSIGHLGQEADDNSGGNGVSAFVSEDGRYVAFTSSASNLVPGDTNFLPDAFVRDRVLGTTRRVSVGLGGAEPDDACDAAGISADGRVVGITSAATNLVAGDTNQGIDCFLATLATGSIERVSLSSAGTEGSLSSWGMSLSGDGRFAVFVSMSPDLVTGDFNNRRDVFVRDVPAHTTTLASVSDFGAQGDEDCFGASISADGSCVAFASLSLAFVPFDNNSVSDAFVRECRTATLFCPGDATNCPCGNGGSGRTGCANSATAGALLDVQGSASVSNDTVTLVASGLPDGAPVLFLQSTQTLGGGSGTTVGDGLRCVGSPVTFLGLRYAFGGRASFGFVGSDPLVSVVGGVPSGGDLRRYQAWYRDTAPFCAPQSFNFTNGAEMLWMP